MSCTDPKPPLPGRCSPIAYGPDDVQARYRRDAVFKGVVDMLHAALHQYEFTPTEMREAVVLACTLHAYRCHPGIIVHRFDPEPR